MGHINDLERIGEVGVGEDTSAKATLSAEAADYWGKPGNADARKFAETVDKNFDRMDTNKDGFVMTNELTDFLADPKIVGEARAAAGLLKDNYQLFAGLSNGHGRHESSPLFTRYLSKNDMDEFGWAVDAAHDKHYALKTALMAGAGAAAFGAVFVTGAYVLPVLYIGGLSAASATAAYAGGSAMLGAMASAAGYFVSRDVERTADKLRTLNYFDLKER